MSRSGANYAMVGSSYAPLLESGKYTGVAPTLAPTAGVFGEGNESGVPIPLNRAITIATVGVEITAPGTAGALIRLGIRSADAAGYASTLLADLGTLDGTAVAGFYEIVANVAVGSGLVWLTATNQGGAGTRPTVRQVIPALPPAPASSGVQVTQQLNVFGATVNSGVPGALPVGAGGFGNALTRVPLLAFKVA